MKTVLCRLLCRLFALNRLLGLALCLMWPATAAALETVTLQLKWTHCFQFAGYYAAQALGYYREVGLDVRFVQGQPGVDVVGRVIAGEAEYGVGTSSLLLARAAGKPVVALAVIFQHSPLVLMTRDARGGQSVHDLVGKRVMIEPDADEIFAYLKREGIAADRLHRVEHSFDVQALVSGAVDAITAYVSNEPELLDRLNVPYQLFTPRSAGIDFYADNLFTSEQELERHPERVRAFRAASLRGWQYAMEHPQEVIDLILSRHAGTDSREHYLYEASRLQPLIRPDLIEIGYMNPGRWRHMADVYAELGVLPAGFTLDGFLYDPSPVVDLSWIYRLIAGVLVVLVGVGGVASYIYRINRRLAHSLKEIEQTQKRLQILSMAIEQSPTSVVITGPDAAIEYVNPCFTLETGYSAEEVMGGNPRILNSGLTDPAVFADMWAHLKRGEAWHGELINRRKSGAVFWEEAHMAPVKDKAGNITHYVAVKLDISARREAYQRLAYMAHHDALTDLPNRVLFFERVSHGLALARRNHGRLALMFIDIDRFKPINDSWGHAVGDLVLQEAARRMSSCIRASDTVGRIGGDEFVVLLLEVGTEDEVLIVAERIRHALNEPVCVAGLRLSISSSTGIAIFPDHGSDGIELARHADAAMYAAKQAGRNQVQIHRPDRPPSA